MTGTDYRYLVDQHFASTDQLSRVSPNDSALKEQTDAFESVILKQMLDIAMKTKDSLFPEATGGDIYESMYHDTLSRSMSGNYGYSELLYNFLKERA